jgi:chromosome segregation ATPase
VCSDLQAKLETEKSMRHKVEARLLETEKKNSEMGVDLMQLQQRVGSLQSQLQTEVEKVRRTYIYIYQTWFLRRTYTFIRQGS